jgi:hypothetical protein
MEIIYKKNIHVTKLYSWKKGWHKSYSWEKMHSIVMDVFVFSHKISFFGLKCTENKLYHNKITVSFIAILYYSMCRSCCEYKHLLLNCIVMYCKLVSFIIIIFLFIFSIYFYMNFITDLSLHSVINDFHYDSLTRCVRKYDKRTCFHSNYDHKVSYS